MADAPAPSVSPVDRHDPRGDRVALLVVGLVLLATLGIAFVREVRPEWKRAQEDARRIAAAHAGPAVADKMPTGLRQVWIPELSRVDRCVSCHVGIDAGADLLEAEHPARSHPRPELIAKHPIERFGCTLCHGGQGAATTKEAAHGEVEFWDQPMLSTQRAKPYGLTAAELMEGNCNACHRHAEKVEGMPLLNEAKEVVVELGCDGCHKIHGQGGVKGPDLTREGDRSPDHLSFPDRWSAPRTALAWHAAHVRAPRSMVPGSKMKLYRPLTDREAAALAVLVMSWRTLPLPAAWLPR